METEHNKPQQKNVWSLVAALLFLGIGSYRLYNHFYNDNVSYGSLRLYLAVGFVGYGLYRLYTYFNTSD